MPTQTLVVETRNSEYRLTIHGSSTRLECVRGTFEGSRWDSAPAVDLPDCHTLNLTMAWGWLTYAGRADDADSAVQHSLIGRSIAFHLLNFEVDRLYTSNVVNVRWLRGDPFVPPEDQRWTGECTELTCPHHGNLIGA